MAWTTPRTWVAGEVPTASIFNAHVRDNLNALTTWVSYTPAWTGATTNPTLGNGTKVGRYISAGKLVHFYVEITMGSTTTYGAGLYSLDLPVTEVSRNWTFTGQVIDASATGAIYPIVAVRTALGSVELRCDPTVAGNNLREVRSAQPITFATGDTIFLSGTYEAA